MATLLYVEDHPPARMLMQAIVSELTGHELVAAASGEEARALAAARIPALYIVDLDLPDTDGLALVRDLKAIHPAPALLVSAYAEAVNTSTLGSLIHTYLAKPLDPVHVAEAIERALA